MLIVPVPVRICFAILSTLLTVPLPVRISFVILLTLLIVCTGTGTHKFCDPLSQLSFLNMHPVQ